MNDRRNTDRRQSDRRQTKTKVDNKIAWRFLTGAVVLLGIVFVWQLFNELSGQPGVVSEKSLVKESKYSFDDFSASDYHSLRAEVMNRDKEMIDKWRKQKAARKSIQDPNHAIRNYEERLAELEDALATHGDFAKYKGSIGWGLKKDIERLKSDPPYFQPQ